MQPIDDDIEYCERAVKNALYDVQHALVELSSVKSLFLAAESKYNAYYEEYKDLLQRKDMEHNTEDCWAHRYWLAKDGAYAVFQNQCQEVEEAIERLEGWSQDSRFRYLGWRVRWAKRVYRIIAQPARRD